MTAEMQHTELTYCLDLPLDPFTRAFLETYYEVAGFSRAPLGMTQRVQEACWHTCDVFLVRYQQDLRTLREAWRDEELGMLAAMSVCCYCAGFAAESGIRASVAERLADGIRQCARTHGIGRGF